MKMPSLKFHKFLIALFLTSAPVLAIADGTPIDNFGIVVPGVYRGGRIADDEGAYAFLRELGVSSIINLEYWTPDNEEFCTRFEIDCKRFRINLPGVRNADRSFDYEMLKKAFKAILESQKNAQKTYIHCWHGSDRTGALSTAIFLRTTVCKGPYDQAKVRDLVKNTLDEYGFHTWYYPTLRKNILSWVENPPSWICEEN